MYIRVKEEALQALKENRPVVALESTIISHGMPYPRNVETALEVERIIREHGAVPCTIGIIDGEGVVGMSPEEIEEFGKRKGIAKVSRRDLPIIMAEKKWGATTVATTMILAAAAGIEVFVTASSIPTVNWFLGLTLAKLSNIAFILAGVTSFEPNPYLPPIIIGAFDSS